MDRDFSKSLMKLILAQGIFNDHEGKEYTNAMADMMESLAFAQASVLVSFLKTTGAMNPDEVAAGCKVAYNTMLKTSMKMYNAVKDVED